MPIFRIHTPEGKTIQVHAPDGTTQEQAIAFATGNVAQAEPTLEDTLAPAGRTVRQIAEVYPALEAGANVATGLASFPPSLVAGTVALARKHLFGEDVDPAATMAEVSDMLTYKPMTQEGAELTNTANLPLTKLGESAHKIGEFVADETGSAGLAATAQATAEMLPFILGVKGIPAAARAEVARSTQPYSKPTSLPSKAVEVPRPVETINEPTPEAAPTPTGTRIESFSTNKKAKNQLTGPHAGRIAAMEGLKPMPNKPGFFIVPEDRVDDIKSILDPNAPIETPSERLEVKLKAREEARQKATAEEIVPPEESVEAPEEYLPSPGEEVIQQKMEAVKTGQKLTAAKEAKKAEREAAETEKNKLEDDAREAQQETPLATEGLNTPVDFSHDAPKSIYKNPVKTTKVKAFAQHIMDTWAVKPGLHVFDDFSNHRQVPEEVQAEAAKAGLKNPKAFRRGHEIWLNAGALHTKADIVRELSHEGFGHIGHELYQGGHLDKANSAIIEGQREKAEAFAKEHGYDLSKPEDARKVAGELVSNLAQTNPRHHLVRQFVSWVRKGLKKLGLAKGLSDNDIITHYVIPARKFMETGVKNPQYSGVKTKFLKDRLNVELMNQIAEPKNDKIADKIRSLNDEISARERVMDNTAIDFQSNKSNKELYVTRRQVESELQDPHLTEEQITKLDKRLAEIDNQIHANNIQHMKTMIKSGKPLSKYKTDFQHDFKNYKQMDNEKLKRLYIDLLKRGVDNINNKEAYNDIVDETVKVGEELYARGLDVNRLPKYPDVDDLGEVLPPDTTIAEADAEVFAKDVQEVKQNGFLKKLHNGVNERAQEMADKVNGWTKEGKYPFQPGDTIKSRKGKLYRVEELSILNDKPALKLTELGVSEEDSVNNGLHYLTDKEGKSYFTNNKLKDAKEPSHDLDETDQSMTPRVDLIDRKEAKLHPSDLNRPTANEPKVDFQHDLETYSTKDPNVFMKSYDWVMDNVRSASDFLQKHEGKPTELGKAIKNLVVYAQTNRGRTQKFMTPMTDKVEASKNRQQIIDQFGDWVKATNSGEKFDVGATDPVARDLIGATRKAIDALGDKMESLNMMATNPETGRKVPFKMREDFIPAILLPKYRTILTNRGRYREEFNEIAQHLIDSGYEYKGQKITSIKEAKDFINDVFNEGNFESGFFGDMGMSKKLPFPPEFYDHSLDAVRKYMDRAAERLAQVEAFTTKDISGKPADLFDETLSEIHKESGDKDPMYAYVSSLKQLVYNDRFMKSEIEKGMQVLNTLATGIQLAGPKSVGINLVGGMSNIVAFSDMKSAMKAFKDVADKDAVAAAQEIANNLGVTSDDALKLLSDNEAMGISKYAGVNKVSKIVSDATVHLMGLKRFGPLKNISFNSSENKVRIVSLLSAKHQLESWKQAYLDDALSGRSKVFEKYAKDEGIDLQKLLKEEGWDNIEASPESARFYQTFVNRLQGSYRLDQVPRWLDTWYGRFLFKYNKYGFQVGRMIDKQIVDYIRDPATRKEGVENLVKYVSLYSTMGVLTAQIIKNIFGDQKLPSMEEFQKVFADKAKEKNFSEWLYLLKNILNSVHVLGALGPISIAQQKYDQYQQYGDNPLSMPGLAIVDNISKFIGKWLWSGWQGDPKELAKDAAKFITSNVSLLSQSSQALGEATERVPRLHAGRVLNRTRQAIQRYIASTGQIEQKVNPQSFLPSIITGEGLKNKVLNDKVNTALMTNNPEAAKEAFKQVMDRLKTKGGSEADKDDLKNAISSSVLARRPFAVYGKPGGEVATKLFEEWAEEHLPAKDYAEMKALDDSYMRAAFRAGLISKKHIQESSGNKALRKYERSQRPMRGK